jgi:hypothetical protein
MQILIFAGSTRQDSYNRKLAKVAASIARQQGAEPSLLELSDYDIPLYNADLEAQGTPADVIRLKQAMHSHAAWIVCSPEYNGSYPPCSRTRSTGPPARSRAMRSGPMASCRFATRSSAWPVPRLAVLEA